MEGFRFGRVNAASLPRQYGLSLIELMLGMLIGLILLGGIIQTMLASKQAGETQRSMSAITDDARFLFDFMARDLRMAGRGYDNDRWPQDASGAPLAPVDFKNGVLTVRYETLLYEDRDSDGLDEEYQNFVVAEYDQTGTASAPGTELQYSRRSTETMSGGRFDLATLSGMTNQPLVAGLAPVAFDVTFGEFSDGGTPDDIADDTTAQRTAVAVTAWDNVVSALLKFSFPNPVSQAGKATKDIEFTVALRNRVSAVIPTK